MFLPDRSTQCFLNRHSIHHPHARTDRLWQRPKAARQTWKLSPQPQRPFSLGLLKVNPDSSCLTS